MGLFQTNWRTQVTNLLPPVLRSTSFIDYLASLVHPLQTDIDANASWEASIRLQAQINSQVILLRYYLNYFFNVTSSPLILVVTSQNNTLRTYFYNESEGLDLYVHNESESDPLYLYNESESIDSYDFTVKIPSGIYTAQIAQQATALVKIFKLTGKTFNVISY